MSGKPCPERESSPTVPAPCVRVVCWWRSHTPAWWSWELCGPRHWPAGTWTPQRNGPTARYWLHPHAHSVCNGLATAYSSLMPTKHVLTLYPKINYYHYLLKVLPRIKNLARLMFLVIAKTRTAVTTIWIMSQYVCTQFVALKRLFRACLLCSQHIVSYSCQKLIKACQIQRSCNKLTKPTAAPLICA